MENDTNDTNDTNSSNATQPSSSSTTQVPSSTVSAISCARFAKDCEGCFANNCRYCRTSPEDWSFINGEPPSIIDYACLSKTWQCIDLQQLRPDVVSVEAVAYNGCGNLVPPKGPTTRLTTTTTTKETERIQSEGHPWWPSEWGIVVWTAIAILGGFSLLLCCYLGHRCRRRLQRVHVLPQSALDSRIFKTKASVKWDFARAGVVSEGDLEAAKKALEAALSQASGHARCLTFWASNCLRVPVLAELDRMLLRFPSLTLSLDADWKRADDATLAQLAKVLMKHRDRCKFRTVGGQALQLPVATVTTLNSLGESFSGHHEVDKVVFEKGPKDAEACRVALGALRLTSQEMIFNRQNLGDMGCSLACGFVRPWGSRLQIARLVECGVGDLGISFLARLLAHARQPAVNLKELNLSANKFGDRGMAELADALPMLDSLEKLLLERNKIGPMGAQALASRLSRSNVRELVLGTHLGGNPIGPAGVQALARGLNDALPRAAANRETRLEALALEDCQVGEEGAKALAEHLSQSALMALSVARGQLTDEDATAILLALPKSTAFLDLSGNQLSDLTASIAGETLYKRSGMSISLAANFLSPTIKMLLSEEHGTRLRL